MKEFRHFAEGGGEKGTLRNDAVSNEHHLRKSIYVWGGEGGRDLKEGKKEKISQIGAVHVSIFKAARIPRRKGTGKKKGKNPLNAGSRKNLGPGSMMGKV